MQSQVLLGAIIGAHGIKGEVKVKSFTEDPDSLGAYGVLMTEDGRRIVITHWRATKGDEAIACLEGVDTRDDAEGLKGQGLYVARSALPEPEAGEYYLADLVGLRVEDESGAIMGKVVASHNFGAGDLIEIEVEGGQTSFVLFTDEFVPVVDIASGRIVARLPRHDDKQ